MRRIERLINLIAALLETRVPLTAEQIRDRIAGYDQATPDAFRRAFERDKEALRAMGIPVEVRKTDPWEDVYDGYIIPKARYYLPQLELAPDELAALRIAAEAVLGGGEEAEAGMLKLGAGHGDAEWPGPRMVWGADLGAESASLGPLYAALLERRAVGFTYESARSGRKDERVLDTYGLVHRRGHWYAVGRDHGDNVVKSFKVSRVVAPVRAVQQRYEIPREFDPSAHLRGEPWEIGPDEPGAATVRFDPAMRWWAEQNMSGLQTREGPGGVLDVDVQVANLDALVSWAIEFAPHLEILAPPAARERLREHLAAFLARVS